jgi:hypothetical protein
VIKALPLWMFGVLSFIMYVINFPFQSFFLSQLLGLIWIVTGFYTTYILYENKNIILSIFLLLNIVTQIYFLFNFFYFDDIRPFGPFDFSAYEIDYVQKASNVLFVVFSVMMFVWALYARVVFLTNKVDIKLKINQLLLPIKIINNRKVIIVLTLVSVFSILILFTSATIFQAPYPFNKKMGLIIFPDSLRPFLVLPYLFAYFIVKIKSNFRNTIKVYVFKVLFFMALYFLLLIIGPRGAATGLIMLMMFFDLIADKSWFTKIMNFLVAIALLYIIVFLWPIMRFDIYSMGVIDAFSTALLKASGISGDFFSVQFSLIPMIPMTLFHFLYVVALVEHGNSLDYQTFINLIPQQVPIFLEPIFGQRPLNDNWLLMKYYFHGGGFYIFANAYWNGGITPMFIFAIVVSWILVKIEKFFKQVKDPLYFLAYPVFVFLIPVNTFYGIQPFIRGLEFGAITLMMVYAYRKIRIRSK